MSNEAITWALSQPVKHSTAKFVLLVMANRADDEMVCWPSTADLAEQTAQDRKTVQENIRRLREWGYIEDTGERKGATKQVIVYRLKTPENGLVKQAQKRGSSANETGPKFPTNRPEIPYKEAQISPLTGPKTGHGTQRNPKETTGNPNKREQAITTILPAWIPLDAWNGFLGMRKAIKKPITPDAIPLAIKKLESLTAAGNDARAVLEQSTMNCWQGLFEVKPDQARASPSASKLGKAGQATALAAQKWLEDSNAG